MIGGVREYFGYEYRKLRWILDNIERVFRSNGYIGYEGSVFESLDILMKKGGEEIKEQIFYFGNLGLRFDHTIPLIRYVSENKDLPRPIKRYTIGKVFRNEDPQRMRYIEFIQADVDIVGSSSIYSTLDVLHTIQSVLKLFNIDYVIYMNDRRFLDKFVEDIDFNHRSKFFRIVDKIDRFGKTWVKDSLEKEGMPSKYLDRLLEMKLEDIKSYSEEAYNVMSQLPCQFKPTMVRGLDYYSGEIFEIAVPNLNVSIGGGGRYSLFDEKNNVGMSIGVSRLYDLIDYKDSEKRVFIAWIDEIEYARYVAEHLRDKGLVVDINTEERSLKKQLEHASKLYDKVIIVGKKEKEKKSVILREMKKSEQKEIELTKLLELLS